jgi:hypothetical protein
MFCDRHDSILFKAIEQDDFELTRQAAALLLFRQTALNWHRRESFVELAAVARTYQQGKSTAEQRGVEGRQRTAAEQDTWILRDVRKHIEQCRDVVRGETWDRIRYFALRLLHRPEIVGACCWNPWDDLDGNELQDLLAPSTTATGFCIAAVPRRSDGLIVFTWLDEWAPVCEPFIRSLQARSDESILRVVERLIAGCGPWFYLAPDWWDSLTAEQAGWMRWHNFRCLVKGPRDWLRVEGPRLLDWRIAERIDQTC